MLQKLSKGFSDFGRLWLGWTVTLLQHWQQNSFSSVILISKLQPGFWESIVWEGHIMGRILAYYWKRWSASTIGLTVNTLEINGDIFHEWEEEQQGLRRIIPLDTNAIFCLMLQDRRTYAAFASSQRRFGWAPGKGSTPMSVCWGGVRGGGQEPENGKGFKFESTGMGQLKYWMSHFSQGKYCAGWQSGNPHPQMTDKDRKTRKKDGEETER